MAVAEERWRFGFIPANIDPKVTAWRISERALDILEGLKGPGLLRVWNL